MKTSTMKVGTRLGLGFALVILCGLIVAIVARFQLDRTTDEVQSLVEQRMANVERINQIQNNLNVVARAVRNIVITEDVAEMQAEKARIEESRASNSPLLKELQDNSSSPEARQLLQKINELRPGYNAALDKAVTLGLSNQLEEARTVLNKEVRQQQMTYFKLLEELASHQKKQMDASAKTVQEIASATSGLVLTLAAIAAALGAAIAWALTRSITHQLGGEPDYASNVAREIAAGNLAVDVQVKTGDHTSLIANMQTMRNALVKVVAHVREGSESVAAASTQIAQGNQDLSSRTESQASALEETASSMEELSSTVRQNADNARQANQLAQSASNVAVQGGEVVAQVVETMSGINASSKKIADIINVIDGIAFQTNILALNAAVEAARAGEQGRGFAVVAGEVRSLASRSAEAAKEIKQLITDSVERVEQGSALVDRAGSTMQEVVTSIRRVTDIMGEISAASSEQSAGVSQVGEAVAQMDQATQQNAALVEEMAAAAGGLNRQAQELVQAVAVFKTTLGAAPVQTAAAPAATPPVPRESKPYNGLERRSPSRAANVARLPAQSKAAPSPAASVLPAAKTGTGDDWESF
ncbi:methyl-accepting chemotaxis protein [Alicycliphilus denitrificans]|uniref:methyl-accepting chemotaxis protein n=1 Tax=Alicycliphilus denitrificans TaxID=179636 RepID=UPI00384F5ECB